MTTDSDFQDSPIGLIPKDWDVVTLTDGGQVEVIMGQSPPGPSYNTEEMGIPFFQGNADFGDLYPVIRIYTIQPLKISVKDDILLSVRAPVGELNLSPCECSIGRGLVAIRIASDNLDLKFLYYYLNYHSSRLSRVEEGTTFKAIKKADLYEFLMVRPPVSEQRIIAEILDTVDRTITQTKQLIAKLRAIKSGLLHDLLTRGIGEDGCVRDPEKQPEEFKETKLGFLPDTWKIKSLDPVDGITTVVTDGSHYSPPQSKTGQYYYATVSNLSEDGINYSSCNRLSKTEYEKMVRWGCKPFKGDVLFSKDGTVGICAVFNDDEEVVLLSSIAIIRPKSNVVDSEFLRQFLGSSHLKKQLRALVGGTAIRRVVLRDIKRFQIPLPPISEQSKIAKILGYHDSRIKAENQYLKKLKMIKAGLMYDLLTGRVRVKVSKEKRGES